MGSFCVKTFFPNAVPHPEALRRVGSSVFTGEPTCRRALGGVPESKGGKHGGEMGSLCLFLYSDNRIGGDYGARTIWR